MNTDIDRTTTDLHGDTEGRAVGRPKVRRRAQLLVVMATLMALTGAACAAPSPPAGPGGTDINFGPLTIPLPPIQIRPPGVNIPVLVCNIGYQPPGVGIVGATVTIPGIRIDPNQPIITVPNVVVRIPQLRIPLSTVSLECLGLKFLNLQVDLIVPSTVVIKAATLNLTARTITLQNPSFEIDGAGIGIAGLGDLIIPLPPIVNIPLPSFGIGF